MGTRQETEARIHSLAQEELHFESSDLAPETAFLTTARNRLPLDTLLYMVLFMGETGPWKWEKSGNILE